MNSMVKTVVLVLVALIIYDLLVKKLVSGINL